jgi:predicted RNA-binding protein with PIN domain
MKQTYYIDGYNVIHLSGELQALMNTDIELAREGLIEKIMRWCGASGEHAKIIFDGQGQQTQQSPHHDQTGPLEVIFSSKYKTADSIIERAVYKSSSKHAVIVVSADRGITDLCMGMGALVMSPNNFWYSIQETITETTRSIQQTRRGQIGRLEDQWDQETIDKLKRLKKKLDR